MGKHLQEIGEGFDRYQKLREQGYGKEEAMRESSKDLAYMLAMDKIDDKFLSHISSKNIFGITPNSYIKEIYDDIYYPKTKREQSAFNRSCANKTSILKEGEKKRIIIDTADNVYFIEADGYMSGDILYVVSNNANVNDLIKLRRSFLDGTFRP